jgi:hypothetical protein
MAFDVDDLDSEDPFELDEGNRAHLFKHDHYSEADLYDIFIDAIYYPADPNGPADWLMVGQPPGEDPLVVPLAPSSNGDWRRARPIGIYLATGPLLAQYLVDSGRGQHARRGR